MIFCTLYEVSEWRSVCWNCKDLTSRVREDNGGKNRYTRGLRPWEILYFEKFPDWASARMKEKYYKSGVGKEELKRKLVP